MNSLREVLTDALSRDERLVTQDGVLLKNKITELVGKKDVNLITSLMGNPKLKAHFFIAIGESYVFDVEKFLLFISSEQYLPDSYTAFKTKIGLAAGHRLLNEVQEVVLSFPYKDCILEGGMTNDESKRQEIFYNSTLAPDEVSRLLEKKAFTGFTKIDRNGTYPVETLDISPDETVAKNLFIKGNNLLVLSSLKARYTGKIKLIYIDPPYNTAGADETFRYNDRFNHATWLTFMKNRLEIAKELLTPDGAIYVQLDYNEVHYCKVLMDEIFGRDNFQREIIWRIGWVSGYKTIEKNWIRNHDSILFYAKNRDLMDFKKQYINYPEGYVRRDGKKPEGKGYAIEDTWNAYGIDSLSDYANDSLDSIAIVSFSKEKVGKFKGQKNEALIKRIVEAHTNEGDIVLDFFGGTGTTAAVAQKMKRRWILVEQIASQVEIAKNRLEAVLAGSQVGISKDVDWKGGGEYLYAELINLNEDFIERIDEIETAADADEIWEDMKISPFLDYQLSTQTFNENYEEFSEFTVEEKKSILFDCLDLNAVYLNYEDIEDTSLNVEANVIELNRSFYGAT